MTLPKYHLIFDTDVCRWYKYIFIWQWFIHDGKILNDEMKIEDTWLKVNKISLNTNKTHPMLFKGNGTAHFFPKISIDEKYIKQVNCTKFLGNYDSWWINLETSYRIHIKKECKRNRHIMENMSYSESINLKNLYCTFIYPYITYCILAWGNACKCHLKKMTTLQKKIVRIIAYGKYNCTTKHLYQDLKFLPFEHLYNLSIGIFLYKYAHNELPCMFKYWFTYNHEIHSYITRQSQHLHTEHFIYDSKKFRIPWHVIVE